MIKALSVSPLLRKWCQSGISFLLSHFYSRMAGYAQTGGGGICQFCSFAAGTGQTLSVPMSLPATLWGSRARSGKNCRRVLFAFS